MKIRDKLLLGFGLYILLAVILGSFAYRELRTINTRLILVETADDITNTILEVRRYEKNFLLFKDVASYEELNRYLTVLKDSISAIQAEIIMEIGGENYLMMKSAIDDYERQMGVIIANLKSQSEHVQLIRKKGRKIEGMLQGEDLEHFLVLRRYEKNIILFKTAASYSLFTDTYATLPFQELTEVRKYRDLTARLFGLYAAEKDAVNEMRQTARKIQSFTQNLSKEERASISTIIKKSASMLVVALALILAFGLIINVKLAGSIADPIVNLERITKKINRGDFSETIEVKGGDETASLASSFNRMQSNLDNAMTSLEEIIKKLQEKQDQLVEAEKLASVGKLAAGIAHEINNPLTSVLTFSNLMLEQCPPGDPRREKLKLMARETNRARNIIRQLLNFGREIVINPVSIDINQPVSEITESLAAQDAFKGLELEFRLAEGLPNVSADPAQIGQVVMNLLLNAIHSITPPGRIELVTRSNGKHVEIVFSDSGRGIPEEHLHKVFDPFFTTKEALKGTGLGLAVSYGIIKKHGGDIEVASAPAAGTTFTVRLPAEQAQG